MSITLEQFEIELEKQAQARANSPYFSSPSVPLSLKGATSSPVDSQ